MSNSGWLARLASRRAAQRHAAASGTPQGLHGIAASGDFELPPGAQRLNDLGYGGDPAQRYDLYLPPAAAGAPIFVMVHGGGWSRGDKALWRSVRHKVAHWVARGYALASVNYRMLPEAPPLAQADDLASALAHIQAHAADWGGNASRLLLVGHSSGAHLVGLLAADRSIAERAQARPWSASIAIDSAALDVVATMSGPHLALHERAFGSQPAAWSAASPLQLLTSGLAAPMLIVCSARRFGACAQAHAFAAKAQALGGARAEVLEADLSHGELNDQLGAPGPYTERVESFIRATGLP